jgi:hypothetical protein
MNLENREFDELARLWKEQPAEPVPWNAEEVLMDVKKKAHKFDRQIFRWNVWETVSGLFAVVVMGVLSFLAPGWVPKVGFGVLVVCVGYVTWRMWRTRQEHDEPVEDVSNAERLRHEIRKVDAQTHLLRSVLSWYMLPSAIGGTVWVTTLAMATPREGAAPVVVILATVGLFSIIGWVVVWRNRRTVKNGLEPYRAELVEILGRLEAGS